MISQPRRRQMFRVAAARDVGFGVDRAAKQIRGAAIIQAGALNDDRPWMVDHDTLEQVAAFGNQPNRGLKARLTHPNMSSDGMGTYLGRWSNFRVDGDKVRADLQLAEAAFNSPKGDLGTYIMDLAEEDPEALGVSIAGILDEVMFDEEHTGELRLAAVRAADIVDEPAATRDGMFSVRSSDPTDIAAIATHLLDTHFSEADPAEVVARFREFLSRYYGADVMATTQQQPPAEPQPSREQLRAELAAEAKRYTDAFGQQGAEWFLAGKTFEQAQSARIEQLSAENGALLEANLKLQARLEAALAATGEAELSSGDPPVELSEKDAFIASRTKEIMAAHRGVSEKEARRSAAGEWQVRNTRKQ